MDIREKARAAGVEITPVVESIIRQYEENETIQAILPVEQFIEYLREIKASNLE